MQMYSRQLAHKAESLAYFSVFFQINFVDHLVIKPHKASRPLRVPALVAKFTQRNT